MVSHRSNGARSVGESTIITRPPLVPSRPPAATRPGLPAWLPFLLLAVDTAIWLGFGSIPLTMIVGAGVAQIAWLWASDREPGLLNVLGTAAFVTSAVVWLPSGSLPVGLRLACVAAQAIWLISARRSDRGPIAGAALVGISALLSTNAEDVVAWLLTRRLITEASTGIALRYSVYASWAGVGLGVVSARSLPLWLIRESRLYDAVRYVLTPLGIALAASGRLLVRLGSWLWHIVLLPARGIVGTARLVWPGIRAMFGLTWAVISGVVAFAWHVVAAVARVGWAGVSYVAGVASKIISVTTGLLWRIVLGILRPIWHGISATARTLLLDLTTLGHLLQSGAAAVAGLCWQGLEIAGRNLSSGFRTLVWLVTTPASAVWHALWQGATWSARHLWHDVTATTGLIGEVLRCLGRRIGLIAGAAGRACWAAIRSTARGLWHGVTAIVTALWVGVTIVVVGIWSALAWTLGILWQGLGAVASLVWVAIVTVSGLCWRAAKAIVGASARTGGACVRVLWVVVACVGRLTWKALTAGARTAWSGVSGASRLAWTIASVMVGAVGVSARVIGGLLWSGFTAATGLLWRVVRFLVKTVWAGASGVAGLVWGGLRAVASPIWRGLRMVASAARVGVVGAVLVLSTVIHGVAGLLWRGVRLAVRVVWTGVTTVVALLWHSVKAICRVLWEGGSFVAIGIGRAAWAVVSVLWAGISALTGIVWRGARFVGNLAWVATQTGVRLAVGGIRTAAGLVGGGLRFDGHYIGVALVWVGSLLGSGIRVTIGVSWAGISYAAGLVVAIGAAGIRFVWPGLSDAGRFLWQGIVTLANVLFLVGRFGANSLVWTLLLPVRSLVFVATVLYTGVLAVPDGVRMLARIVRTRKEVPAMSDFRLTRERMNSLIATLFLFGVAGYLAWMLLNPPQPVVVAHWANGHVMRKTLLNEMSEKFNQARFRTQAGTLIRVTPIYVGSAEQVDDLVSRVTSGVSMNKDYPDPTIVTPAADHWLVAGNRNAGRTIVDLKKTRSIALTYVGIVTYREIAECLGWPKKEIGYADIIALRKDPRGWLSYPCSKTEWGQTPLLAYTDPRTSSTGRSALFSLFAIAARKTPMEITEADVTDPEVAGYVKNFQGLVDHYMPGTIPMNTRVYQGPKFSHFFILPEDNLIHLYEGTETAIFTGVEQTAPPLKRDVVMIYPKEGSAEHNHSASIPEAPWITPEQREAAEIWINYLRQDEQQRAFAAAGFRPVTGLPPGEKISGRYGLDPTKPTVIVNPDRIEEEAFARITATWPEIKRPGIVTFVADTSGTMIGKKLDQEKAGLIRAFDGMFDGNQVGLVTFGDTIGARVDVAPLSRNKFALARAVDAMKPGGETSLYDAIKAAVEMTDAAPGDESAIRAVVVLTDGKANKGSAVLTDIIQLETAKETRVSYCRGWEGETSCLDESGSAIEKKNLIGRGLAIQTRHPIQVFCIWIGDDADHQIGRLLSESTGADFRVTVESALAAVIETFSMYF